MTGTKPPVATDGETMRAKTTGMVLGVAKRFNDHSLIDAAAALTYYAVLSIFPGLLVVAAGLGLLGATATKSLFNDLTGAAPASVRETVQIALDGLTASPGTAGIMAIVGLFGALWAATGYVGAFMRASNVVYGVAETRPLWKKLPLRLGITVVLVVMLVLSAIIVVFTGRMAETVGKFIGVGPALVATWDVVKWPVLVLVVALIVTVLYWAGPNAALGSVLRQVPGGLLAVGLWLLASGGFAIYVANFASYDRTYGTLGGVIVFFIWLWMSNLAVLVGAEFNAMRRLDAEPVGEG